MDQILTNIFKTKNNTMIKPDARAAYESYVQIWNESKIEVLYDVDERPMFIRTKNIGDPLSWSEWLPGEMEIAIEEEAYEYAAILRDELKLLNDEKVINDSDADNGVVYDEISF